MKNYEFSRKWMKWCHTFICCQYFLSSKPYADPPDYSLLVLPSLITSKFIWFFVMQQTVSPYQLHDAFIPQAVVELGVDQTKRREVTFQPLEISIWWYDTNNSKFVHINLNDSFSQINLAVNYFKKLFATIHVFTHSLWSSWDLFSTSLASELLLLWGFPHVLWSLNQHHFLIESEWTKLYIKDR